MGTRSPCLDILVYITLKRRGIGEKRGEKRGVTRVDVEMAGHVALSSHDLRRLPGVPRVVLMKSNESFAMAR